LSGKKPNFLLVSIQWAISLVVERKFPKLLVGVRFLHRPQFERSEKLCAIESVGYFRGGIEARLSRFYEVRNKISNRGTDPVMVDILHRPQMIRVKWQRRNRDFPIASLLVGMALASTILWSSRRIEAERVFIAQSMSLWLVAIGVGTSNPQGEKR
jgi:hypothetical protein